MSMSEPGCQRYMSCKKVVVDVFTQIMREYLQEFLRKINKTYSELYERIHKKVNLKEEEKKVVESLVQCDSLIMFDISLLFKIFSCPSFDLMIVNPPTNGSWHEEVGLDHITTCDDIKRMTKIRNGISHLPSCSISETRHDGIFKIGKEIAVRADKFLKKRGEHKFENDVQKCKSCVVDDREVARLNKAIKDPKIKTSVVVGSNRQKVDVLEHETLQNHRSNKRKNETAKDRSTNVKMTLHNIESPKKKAKLLNENRHEVNQKMNPGFQILSAESSSLILHLIISERILNRDKALYNCTQKFIQLIFKIADLRFDSVEEKCYVLIEIDEDTYAHNENQTESFLQVEGNRIDDKQEEKLVLNFEVDDDVLTSDQKLQENFQNFFNQVAGQINGKQLSRTGETIAIIEIQEDECHGKKRIFEKRDEHTVNSTQTGSDFKRRNGSINLKTSRRNSKKPVNKRGSSNNRKKRNGMKTRSSRKGQQKNVTISEIRDLKKRSIQNRKSPVDSDTIQTEIMRKTTKESCAVDGKKASRINTRTAIKGTLESSIIVNDGDNSEVASVKPNGKFPIDHNTRLEKNRTQRKRKLTTKETCAVDGKIASRINTRTAIKGTLDSSIIVNDGDDFEVASVKPNGKLPIDHKTRLEKNTTQRKRKLTSDVLTKLQDQKRKRLPLATLLG